MFTGLIQSVGTVHSVTITPGATRITISAPIMASRLKTGDSIAVSGVCLTAVDITSEQFSADLAAETIARTTLAHLKPGTLVNLELPTPAGAPMGGHIVQGHVDGTATLLALTPTHPTAPTTTDWRLTLRLPPTLIPHVVPQGSIAIEGISLTVAALQGDTAEIAIIPHTYAATTLHSLPPGTPLNIETDILPRYQTANSSMQASIQEADLLANGF